MKAFITGITGFIGSHVAEHLLSEKDTVLGTARSGWHEDAPSTLVNAVELVPWDIGEAAPPDVLERVKTFDPDVVFHFAGISIPALCGGKDGPTDQAVRVNVHGTNHVLDLGNQLGNPRVVFASTCHLYERVSGEQPFVTEDSPIVPTSAYGQTKANCEREILRRVRVSNLNACLVRGFHHIGPRQPSGLMLTDWLEQLQVPSCSELQVRNTNSFLDLVDVRDAARAYRLLATVPSSEIIYNLGSGRISKSGDVLDTILAEVEREFTVVARSTEEQWNPIADMSRLQSLGWQPTIEYSQTVRDMLAAQSK